MPVSVALKASDISERSQRTFWSRVLVRGDDECWPWQGYTPPDRLDYGAFCTVIGGKRRLVKAHRIAYVLENGPLTDNDLVMHSCDFGLCCNPSHLSAGTPQDNMDDKIAKGRAVYVGPAPKLTDQQVAAVLSDPRSQRLIAQDYSVSQALVSKIKNHKRRSSGNAAPHQ